jgi:hypothetical protein
MKIDEDLRTLKLNKNIEIVKLCKLHKNFKHLLDVELEEDIEEKAVTLKEDGIYYT